MRSAVGPSRHTALPHEFGLYGSKADVVTSHMTPPGLSIHGLVLDPNQLMTGLCADAPATVAGANNRPSRLICDRDVPIIEIERAADILSAARGTPSHHRVVQC